MIQVVSKETVEKEYKVFAFQVVTQEEYHPQVQTLMATIYSPKKTKSFPLHQKLSFVINTGDMKSMASSDTRELVVKERAGQKRFEQ